MINEHYQNTKKYQDDIVLTDEIKRAVMSKVDVKAILESWGVHPVYRNGQWNGYCPTHFIHDGHRQHAPKWSMSAETGDSTCFTSNKHENFIWIAKKLYRLDTLKETIDKLLGDNVLEIPAFGYVVEENDSFEKEQEELEKKRLKILENQLNWLSEQMRIGGMSDECLEYFAKDGIEKDTLDFFHITSVEKGWWKYQGRAIIPFFKSQHELCGFIAVSYKSKEWQCENMANVAFKIDSSHTLDEYYKVAWEKYKKVWYCPGFTSRNHLFGRYEAMGNFTSWDELMIVEGERDCIKMLQEGMNCVAVHGTIIKNEQIAMLRKMNPDVTYLGFDMDEAGRNACAKAYNQLSGELNKIYTLSFPDGKDPKKFNGQEMRKILDSSKE